MPRNIFSPGNKTSRDLSIHSLWCQYKVVMNEKVDCNDKRSIANLVLLPISKSRAKPSPHLGSPARQRSTCWDHSCPLPSVSVPCPHPYLARIGCEPSRGPRALPLPGEFFLARAGDMEVVRWGTWKRTDTFAVTQSAPPFRLLFAHLRDHLPALPYYLIYNWFPTEG